VTYQLTNLTVVTGASSGIGAEIARRLVAAIADRPVDLLVNSAGFATYGSHADLDPRAEAGVMAAV
jgi:short-subunit dehydrogenase